MAHLDLRSHAYHTTKPDVRASFYSRHGKRALDLALALLLLPVLVPLIALLVLLTRNGGAPGLFAHRRIGRHGQEFTCWKIRTMVRDAPAMLDAHLRANPAAAVEWARTHKLQDDPRVTRLGRFLRRTSLDELPQIWNVLRGDMSLVGPRPITWTELDRYGPHADTYLSLKPGVTGHWQVHGRTNGCYDERLQMDRSYASRISLWRDLGLIFSTARVVLWPKGR